MFLCYSLLYIIIYLNLIKVSIHMCVVGGKAFDQPPLPFTLSPFRHPREVTQHRRCLSGFRHRRTIQSIRQAEPMLPFRTFGASVPYSPFGFVSRKDSSAGERKAFTKAKGFRFDGPRERLTIGIGERSRGFRLSLSSSSSGRKNSLCANRFFTFTRRNGIVLSAARDDKVLQFRLP